MTAHSHGARANVTMLPEAERLEPVLMRYMPSPLLLYEEMSMA